MDELAVDVNGQVAISLVKFLQHTDLALLLFITTRWRFVQHSFWRRINNEVPISADGDDEQFVESFLARRRFKPLVGTKDSYEWNLRFSAPVRVTRHSYAS